MEVLTLSNSNFTGLSSNYTYDQDLIVNTDNHVSYEGLNVSIIDGLCAAVDTSTNYYSSFVLSNKTNVNDFVTINNTTKTFPYSTTTYLALYTAGNVLPQSKVLATSYTNTLSVAAYPIFFNNYQDNTTFQNYTINFIDNETCTITQVFDTINYYLSYYQSNTGVGTFLMVNRYQNDEVNLFNYLYDTIYNQIVLTKKVNGLQKYVSYGDSTGVLSMVDFVTGGDIFVASSAFRIRDYNNINLQIPTDWYSYVKQIDVDGLQVNNERCVDNVPLNYLFNFTLEKLSSNSIPLNIMPLKNDKDNENSLSRGSIINNEYDGVIQRTYTSLNTGTTQIKGSPDFNTTFNSYTTQLLIPKDNTTFFYFPYEPFPVIKLNINDSSLVNSGAIAGDKPINSDKVFKRKVKQPFAVQYNSNDSEQTGTYLCSWLKGGIGLSALPIWVDRYYNPTLINSIDALTYNDSFTTEFDILATNNPNNVQYPVYDIKSNLTFEAGYQYAIQHLGDRNIIELIDTLSGSLVQHSFTNKYDYINQYYEYIGDEITLGNNYYSKILNDTQIAEIAKYNNFTIAFDLSVSNWSENIGYQIFGNYNSYGLGIFNDQQITPFVITYDTSVISVYNSTLTLLDTVDVDSNIVHLCKLDPVGSIITITENDYLTRVDYNSVIVDKKYIENITKYTSYYSTLEHTYCYSPFLSAIKINNASLDYEIINQNMVNVTVSNVSPTTYAIVVVDGIMYLVPGTNIKSLNGKIFFTMQSGVSQVFVVYDIARDKSSVLFITDIINDYIINEDNTIYLLYNNNTLLLTDTEYRIQTANNFPIVLFADQPSLSGVIYTGFDCIQNKGPNNVGENGLCFIGFDNTTKTKYLIRTNKFESSDLLVIEQLVSLNYTNATGFRNVTNYNFNHNNLTTQGELEFRLGLPNVYDKTQVQLLRYVHNITTLESGYHNFIIRFDSVNGVYSIFIDGIKVNEQVIQGGQYSFSGIINKEFLIGNCIYYNNYPLGFYTKQPTYYFTNEINMKNFHWYNQALSYYDMLLFVKLNYPISDIRFELPTGKRNFVETIQQFFKFKIPGFKSNYFNVHIVNLPVTGTLQTQLNSTFIDVINRNKPGYTQLNTITYHE